jgi:hypothetical protein
VKKWLQHAAQLATIGVGEVAAFTVESVGRIPLGIAKATPGRRDTVQELLRSAANFSLSAPSGVLTWVGGIFEEHPEMTAEAMLNMLSLEHWIEAFEKISLTDADPVAAEEAASTIASNTGQWGPIDFLMMLTPLERRERFADLVVSVIPDDAQKDPRFKDIFSETDPTRRHNVFAHNKAIIVPALKKIYGLKEFTSVPDTNGESMDEKLAREAIEQKFFLFDANGNKVLRDGSGSGGTALLYAELQEQLRRRPGRLTVAGIREQMEAGNPPASLMLGAVNSGVVTDADIQKAVPELNAMLTERQLVSNEQRRQLEEVTRASRDELKRGAETMTDRFNNAPGFLKLALVAALIGGVMKFPKTGALIGAIFAGQYFIMGDKNPLNTAGNKVQAALGLMRGKSVVPQLGNKKAVGQLGEQILSLIPDQLHETINDSVTGFTLLAGLDISDLAENSVASDPSGRMVILNAWGQPLRTAIRGSLKSRTLNEAAAGRFFPSEDTRAKDKEGNPLSVDCSKNRNLCETGDALAGVFFLMGCQRVKNGTHRNKTLDMATLGIIERARAEHTRTGEFDSIDGNLALMHPQRSEKVNIRDAYYLVMMEGMEAAKDRPGTTLEQIMRELAAVSGEASVQADQNDKGRQKERYMGDDAPPTKNVPAGDTAVEMMNPAGTTADKKQYDPGTDSNEKREKAGDSANEQKLQGGDAPDPQRVSGSSAPGEQKNAPGDAATTQRNQSGEIQGTERIKPGSGSDVQRQLPQDPPMTPRVLPSESPPVKVPSRGGPGKPSEVTMPTGNTPQSTPRILPGSEEEPKPKPLENPSE